ncbi:MAG: hypothetical protein DME65_05735, partial [Verrucomicrobia bacterium]
MLQAREENCSFVTSTGNESRHFGEQWSSTDFSWRAQAAKLSPGANQVVPTVGLQLITDQQSRITQDQAQGRGCGVGRSLGTGGGRGVGGGGGVGLASDTKGVGTSTLTC